MSNAKILLKRKKLYEQEIENILNSRLTLEDNMINLENMHLHKIAVNALSYAANTHKKLNNEMYVKYATNVDTCFCLPCLHLLYAIMRVCTYSIVSRVLLFTHFNT